MIHQIFNSVGGRNEVSHYIGRGFPISHIHHRAELVAVEKGKAELMIDGNQVTAAAGEFVLILPDQIHSFRLDDDSACFVQVFSTDCASGFFSALGTRTISQPIITPSEEAAQYWRAVFIKDLHTTADKPTSYSITPAVSFLKLRSALYAVLSEFLECELCERRGAHEKLLGEIAAYVIEHCTEELTLKGVSAHFGYEPHYFSKLLKRVSNSNFRQLINRCRIDIAVELLENGNAGISEIAAACGYSSQRTFNRVFLALEGVTPGEFRAAMIRPR